MPIEVKQIYTNYLAEAAYFVVSGKEAAVIDPLRDPAPYLRLAEEHGAVIKYVIETHFHADFVSGHVELAKAAGAVIVYGPMAEPAFDAHIAFDGEELPLGDATIRVLHTPGHTMESSCFLLLDADKQPKCVFTGDTLFLGDAGRPDLAQKPVKTTKEDLAKLLFQSLRTKIMPLPDHVIVYPGHCVGSIRKGEDAFDTRDHTFSELGLEKHTNPLLRSDMTEADFVTALLTDLDRPPSYFGQEIALNKGVSDVLSFDSVIARGMTPLSVREFKQLDEDVLVLDTRRDPQAFCACHVPRSIFAGVEGSLAMWIATVYHDVTRPFAIVCDPDTEALRESLVRLARMGFDNCLGHLDGGIAAWQDAGEPCGSFPSVEATEFLERLEDDPDALQVVDIRGPCEGGREGRLEYALSAPLCREPIDFDAYLHPDRANYVYCQSGHRSIMFLSIALRMGVKARIAHVKGGWKAMEKVEQAASKARTLASAREMPMMIAG